MVKLALAEFGSVHTPEADKAGAIGVLVGAVVLVGVTVAVDVLVGVTGVLVGVPGVLVGRALHLPTDLSVTEDKNVVL
jgi:hypothetical protein